MEQVAVEVIKEWGLVGIIIVVISAVCAFLGYLYYTERKNNSSNNNFDSVKYSYPDSAGTTSTDLTAGYYILKIELQQKKE